MVADDEVADDPVADDVVVDRDVPTGGGLDELDELDALERRDAAVGCGPTGDRGTTLPVAGISAAAMAEAPAVQ